VRMSSRSLSCCSVWVISPPRAHPANHP